MKPLSFGIRFFVAALFLGLAGLLLFFAFQAYQRESVVDLNPPAKENEGKSRALVAQELKQELTQSQLQPARYRAIEDRNLFSPKREAWAPPEPEPEAVEESANSATKRTDVQLFGTFRMKDKRYAILGLPFLKTPYPRHTVVEGQTVTSEDSKDKLSYTLLAVQDDSVLMQDNTGEKFKVLFGEKASSAPVSSAAASASSVVVTSQAPAAGAAESGGGSGKKAASGGTVTKNEGPKVDPGLISREKREQMIRDGSLLKVKTPFGDIYKYPD